MNRAFGEIWSELISDGVPDTARRVAPGALVHQYISVDSNLRPSYIWITKREPFNPEQLDTLEITKTQTGAGDWALKITLLNQEFLTEFETLCSDVSHASRDSASEESSLAAMKHEYESWINFFKVGRGISLAEARGLFAELFVLRSLGQPHNRWREVVEAWVGPQRADQDFQFNNGIAVEVKSLLPSSAGVQIASERQLDFKGNLFLALLTVVQADPALGAGSIEDLSNQIVQHLDSDLLDGFRAKMRQAKFSLTSGFCTETLFAVSSSQVVDANAGDFPKLVGSQLPSGVSNTSYVISIARLGEFDLGEVESLEQRVF